MSFRLARELHYGGQETARAICRERLSGTFVAIESLREQC